MAWATLARVISIIALMALAGACVPRAPAASPTAGAAAGAPAKPAEAAGPAVGAKPLVVAISTEPSTLDGQAVIDRNSRVATGSIFESLLDRDRTAKITPWLAESYESVDETTWRFRLRQGVTFQNGEPFNAEAAAFSVNRIISKDYQTQRASYVHGITGARVVDEHTIDVTTDGVNAVLPAQMTQLVMVPPNAAADARAFGEKPVGTGAYKLTSWDKGREIKLTANDAYWGTKARIKDVTLRLVPDPQTALAGLQTGEVDIVLDLLPEQAQLAPKVASVPSTDFSYVGFNTYRKELSDPRVRIAMNMAIDKGTLAKTVFLGNATPNHAQHLSEGMVGFNPNVTSFPYDPEKARQLLAEAGYPNGFDVTINYPIGRFVKGQETIEYMAAQLGAIGLRVKINGMEWNAYRTAGRVKGTEPNAFDLKFDWNSNEWFDGSRVIAHITCNGTSSKFCDPKVDALMDKGIKTIDPKARDQIYQDVWARLHENPHAIYLLRHTFMYGLTQRVQWEPRPDDEYRFADMHVVGE